MTVPGKQHRAAQPSDPASDDDHVSHQFPPAKSPEAPFLAGAARPAIIACRLRRAARAMTGRPALRLNEGLLSSPNTPHQRGAGT